MNVLQKSMAVLRKAAKARTGNRSGTRLHEQHQEILDMLDNSKDVIYHFQIEPEWKFVYLSPAMDIWLGEGTVEAALRDPSVPFQLVHPDDLAALLDKVNNGLDYDEPIIQRWKDRDGHYHWFEERMTPIYENGKMVALQGVTRNIDQRMEQNLQLEYQAHFDALTGLHNRAHFNALIRRLDEDTDTPVGLILCDVDDLKVTNDRYGHEAGDRLLQRVATFLKQHGGIDTTVARLGGDEFILVIAGEHAARRSRELRATLLSALAEQNNMQPDEAIHLSIGCAIAGTSIRQMSGLLRQADEQMYRNKSEKRLDGAGRIPVR